MGLMSKIKNEFVDIIEWIDDSRSTLAWRFPRYQNEIKNGAQLIVREGQKAIFVYRGAMADTFDPGNYELKSENLPILSTLQGWKYGFDSPFRSEVYFINTRPVTSLRWPSATFPPAACISVRSGCCRWDSAPRTTSGRRHRCPGRRCARGAVSRFRSTTRSDVRVADLQRVADSRGLLHESRIYADFLWPRIADAADLFLVTRVADSTDL